MKLCQVLQTILQQSVKMALRFKIMAVVCQYKLQVGQPLKWSLLSSNGGKFGQGGYKSSRVFTGVGASVVNAL